MSLIEPWMSQYQPTCKMSSTEFAYQCRLARARKRQEFYKRQVKIAAEYVAKGIPGVASVHISDFDDSPYQLAVHEGYMVLVGFLGNHGFEHPSNLALLEKLKTLLRDAGSSTKSHVVRGSNGRERRDLNVLRVYPPKDISDKTAHYGDNKR